MAKDKKKRSPASIDQMVEDMSRWLPVYERDERRCHRDDQRIVLTDVHDQKWTSIEAEGDNVVIRGKPIPLCNQFSLGGRTFLKVMGKWLVSARAGQLIVLELPGSNWQGPTLAFASMVVPPITLCVAIGVWSYLVNYFSNQ